MPSPASNNPEWRLTFNPMLNHYSLFFPKEPSLIKPPPILQPLLSFFFQKEILENISKCGISEAQVKWEIKNRKMHLQWSLGISFQSFLKIRLWRQSFFQIEKCDFTVKWKNEVFLSEIPIFSLCVKGSEQEVASIYDCWHVGLPPRTIREILDALRKSSCVG